MYIPYGKMWNVPSNLSLAHRFRFPAIFCSSSTLPPSRSHFLTPPPSALCRMLHAFAQHKCTAHHLPKGFYFDIQNSTNSIQFSLIYFHWIVNFPMKSNVYGKSLNKLYTQITRWNFFFRWCCCSSFCYIDRFLNNWINLFDVCVFVLCMRMHSVITVLNGFLSNFAANIDPL